MDLNIFDWSFVADLLYKKWYHVLDGVRQQNLPESCSPLIVTPFLNAQNKCSDQQVHSKNENHDDAQ
jgi:hypothetical protein